MAHSNHNDPKVGLKFDGGKPDWSLIPLTAVEEVVAVMSFGAAKYGRHNWQGLEDADDRYFAAALRHLAAHQAGELFDLESNLPHLAHAATNLIFLLWFLRHGQ